MLNYVSGTLEEVGEGYIVVDNNGLGYEISTSFHTIGCLPDIGEPVKIYTKLVPKEDAINLYGFYEKGELNMFNLLLIVSGIGPKGALAILSSMTVDEIKFAVLGEDAKAFAKVPGVGKKTAERAIIDLKDKVDLMDAFEGKLAAAAPKPKTDTIASVKAEVMDALVSLGYTKSNAAKALEHMTITESTTTEQLLSDTLKQMSFL